MTLADRSTKNDGLINWTPEPDDPRTAFIAIAILKAVKDVYEDAAKIAETCETGVGAAFNIRAHVAEVFK